MPGRARRTWRLTGPTRGGGGRGRAQGAPAEAVAGGTPVEGGGAAAESAAGRKPEGAAAAPEGAPAPAAQPAEAAADPAVAVGGEVAQSAPPAAATAAAAAAAVGRGDASAAEDSIATLAYLKSKLVQLAPEGEDESEWVAGKWKPEEHDSEVDKFLEGEAPCLFLYLSRHSGELLVGRQIPVKGSWNELLFCIRDSDNVMRTSKLSVNVLGSLLAVMEDTYVDMIINNTSWPDSVRKDFTAQVHKFMANLTESVHSLKGKTVLYIPGEDVSDAQAVAREKDLVQRLESTLIHWTRQIKEVVNNQDNSELGEDAGPLAEIEFWRSRSVDLGGIREQLETSGVANIVAVLEQAKSSYLPPFLSLSNLIQREAVAAEDNLKFLSSLEKPCQALAKAEPKDILPILPKILYCVRMIWNISRFYNTEERLAGLLRKVSNEIINRCCKKISLDEIFEGDVKECMTGLRESIRAGEAWKRVYQATAAAVKARSARSWDFDVTSIFAHTDAFVQRCRDMLEVCEAQLQFAPKTEMPTFGGTRGTEITKSILDIQVSFQKLVTGLRSLNYGILDVTATQWHDDYNVFKSGVKDLEVMMTNVIMLAFDCVTSLESRVELLEAFQSMAKRESIRRCVEKKTSECYAEFLQELNIVKKHFDQKRRSPPVHRSCPKYAGAALWAVSLSRRLERPMEKLVAAECALPVTPERTELHEAHSLALNAIEQYVKNQHLEWFNTIEAAIATKLENSLIFTDDSKKGLLESNFDRHLLELFQEVNQWERMHLEVPYIAMEINSQRESHRILREYVLLVVRDYNQILDALDPQERRLFADRIHYLDRRISPGVHKLNWVSSKNHLDYFVREARKYCKEVETTVMNYKDANRRIEENCRLVSETLLIAVEKKHIYEHGEFDRQQDTHRKNIQLKFEKAFEEIKETMAKTYETFSNDSEEVQEEWIKYTEKLDKKMEESLRHTVKKSLQELSRMLNGDAKTEVTPIFNVILTLDKTKRVGLQPSVQDMFQMIHSVCGKLITVIKCMPRLSQPIKDEDGNFTPMKTYYEIISNDEEATLKTVVSITSGVTSIVERVQDILNYWERKYKNIWDQDKESLIKRYEKQQRPLSDFDADITRYKDLISAIIREDSSTNSLFLRIDSAPLKQTLVSHCEVWIGKFTGLLNSLAKTELLDVLNYFQTNTETLENPPSNLDMLAESVKLHRSIVEEEADIKARFAPLEDKYKTLEKFDVPITDEENEMRESVPGKWVVFQQMLDDVNIDLGKSKQNFHEKLSRMVENFVREMAEQRDEFQEAAPYHHNEKVNLETAWEFIELQREELGAARKTAASLKEGMLIFEMEQPPYKELAASEKELEQLDSIWTCVKEWDGLYNSWKGGKFKELEIDSMEEEAVRMGKRIVKLGRELKQWGVWSWIKDIVDSFKKTMPLIMDLRNEAMRSRHWAQLMDAVGSKFDPESDDFTLNLVIQMRLDQHAELIGDLSSNASKELAIEQTLKQMGVTWSDLDLDMVLYREGIYKLRSTEDIFLALEDNTVMLSTMKASKFFPVFSQQIGTWEQSLSLVSEMIEMIQQVQKSWMYLENIFVGSEDIRKQLPQESIMFDLVHNNFIQSMAKMEATKNALKAASLPKMLDNFIDMDTKLEKIQKSLENYLESKRQQFPRFYFLSSDDLLEILGQAKDPQNVQPHLKKCFEGIKKLEMHAPGTEARRHWEASGIFSPDGEYIPYISQVLTEGRPEDWLNNVEAAMYSTTKRHLYKTLEDSKGMKKEKWVREFPGQCIISAGQILWTTACEKALAESEGSKSAMRQLKKKWVSLLNKYVSVTRGKLSKVERKKVVALITIEVHARDVIEKLAKAGCRNVNDFEWVSQLRFYWDKEKNDCVVKQVLSVFEYGYEYQGNNGRLVITPLTDRCYMTLGAAMFTRRGGNPLGPAGTGKTETVKDFGKALARYVIVFNCSDGVDYKMTGKMFSGLAQTGAWACLDEFNRIEVEVLSVVATQISIVMQAIKEGRSRFNFLGRDIRLIPSCGIFVTMNPGYAGRSELPDNLKAIVRPVSMMVPDFTLIAEIMMFAEGFQTAKALAKKMISIMELSQQQLSKQDHYDYGLRSFVIPIARAAGSLKRDDPDASEEVIMYRTMLDLIKPKLVYLDLPLFMALLSDLFPGVELPQNDGGSLRRMLESELRAANLQVVDEYVVKIIQIFDCKVARHGNMIVGKTGAGKTEAWKCLTRAMAKLKEAEPNNEVFEKVHVNILNPLALSNDELYGCFDPATHEWQDGVLARTMRNVCKDESLDQKWILFDGPVDTLWIESMNTLLDDNKLLTLLNGERISMPAQVSILFEVEDLSVASPATVSRAGMIYLNVEDLGWEPFTTSWLATKEDTVMVEVLQKLIAKFVQPVLEFKRRECKEPVPIDQLSAVRCLCTMFDAMATAENGVSPSNGEAYPLMIELTFLFSLIWTIGATVDEAGRAKIDALLREMDARFPSSETVYEYYVDPKKKGWAPFEEKLPQSYKPPADTPFFKMMVPTVDTVRSKFIASKFLSVYKHTLIVGNVGVGKTMVAQSVLEGLPETKNSMAINFSAQTSSNSLQETIEGKLEKRTKGVFTPAGGKKMVVFVDDMNMPKKSTFGFMPPLELLKLWIDNGFWYDRIKCELKHIKELQLLTAMAPPGGGRSAFSQRISACFAVLNMTAPDDIQLTRIFGTLLTNKLSDFDDEIKPLGEPLTTACIAIYRAVTETLLPTPSKSHYVFNTRDLAKVIQGVMQATKQFYDSKESMLQLFVHESSRIYMDRMWDPADKKWLQSQLDELLGSQFSTSWGAIFEDGNCPPFVSFLRNVENPPYEPVQDISKLKAFLVEKLEDYALEPGHSAMDLVLFRDALFHICKIHRVLMQPRGNSLLVGVGGSGRKSLSRLASYVAELKCFSIEISRNYRTQEWRDDLKSLYMQAGCQNKPTVFLFDETQIVTEVFLEDVNNILTSGEVPNLFGKDEIGGIVDEVRAAGKAAGVGETQDALYAFFLERVRTNLHIVLCLSPIGELFRARCRMFPGLVNCTTIDWFVDWPDDALFEVAQKELEEENLGSDEIKDNVCKTFVTAHQSTSETSKKMLAQNKRHNYVTPTNYLEFVNGYRALLKEKRSEIGDKAKKLTGGLQKLDETGVQVGEMQQVCIDKKKVVAKAKRDCEELLVEIVQDKRVADEQEKAVNAEATKIAKEADEANAMASECQAGLDKALPALEAAEEALNVLTKKDMSELKAYSKPPAMVEVTLAAVMTVFKKPATWDEAKKQLGDSEFLKKLQLFDKDKLDDSLLKKIGKFTSNTDWNPESVGKVSSAAKGLCLWVFAMETYGHTAKEIAPKRMQLKSAQQALAKKQAQLKKAQDALDEVLAKVQALKDKYEESTASKEALQRESDELEMKLERAEKLVNGLAGERSRWEASINDLENLLVSVPGDCVVAAAFMSYAGPFPSEYRDELVNQTWLHQVKALGIPSSPEFDFALFLANPSDVRDWNIQGLPADSFSTENGVMVTRGKRWPLMIDPQMQANNWIKKMEQENGLKVLNQNQGDMMRQMETAIQFGQPVLLQDVMEEMDPALEPVLGKNLVKKGNQVTIKLGDKEVDYNPEFKLYITTKLPNPHYTPEVSTKTTIINFSVKEQGLEAQLLNIVVQKERPDLDKQKNDLVVKVATGKRTQADLEDKILYMLSTAEGSLLDNIELITTLDESKTTWEEVSKSLEVAEETSKKIEEASQAYRPCSIRSALLYFVLNDLANIDPMYQFSLAAYNELFLISIAQSPKSDNIQDRIKSLNDYHTFATYRYTSRALFEKHKLLLSLQMCVRILQSANQVNMEEWQFFLRGGSVLDKSSQPNNPNPSWITEESWDNITELEGMPQFKDVVSNFEQSTQEWEQWYRDNEPETADLPGEWESKCNELQRMIFVRCLRPDRVIFAATTFVTNALGRKYVEPPVLDLRDTHADSTPFTPLVFVLSPGVDPVANLLALAAEFGLSEKFHAVALGQGQAPIATNLIEVAVKEGNWVFLANCHLMTSWLPKLEEIIEDFPNQDPHQDFRLWLSSNPSPKFPIAILQKGIKMTTEPPKGLRANLIRLYNGVTEESFHQCQEHTKYTKLFFSLVFFHAVLLERRKFRTLGLNIPYDFNDTDFAVSDDLLKTYLEEYEETPWDALKYLISEANYGGRVTDELDRRVLNSYLNQYYCEDALSISNYALSPLPVYFVPETGPLQSYKDYVQTLPINDSPEAFGQHSNAEISYLITETSIVLSSLVSLQPRSGGGGGDGNEEIVQMIISDLLAQLPPAWSLEDVMKSKADDPSALHVVLFQEIERYNVLINKIRLSCQQLQKGIKGLVVMSAELDDIFEALFNGRVPAVWLKTYPSLKMLGPWTRDLFQRLDELNHWVVEDYPKVYWLSGFTYPTSFLTAVLQTTARKNAIPIDTLSFEYTPINLEEKEIAQPPKEGVYVKGLFLEGAGWEAENSCLTEPKPMELVLPMPIFLFKPVENKKKSTKGIYSCPMYLYPIRTGSRERPSFMIMVELKSGSADPDHWVKRGTALLLSLAV